MTENLHHCFQIKESNQINLIQMKETSSSKNLKHKRIRVRLLQILKYWHRNNKNIFKESRLDQNVSTCVKSARWFGPEECPAQRVDNSVKQSALLEGTGQAVFAVQVVDAHAFGRLQGALWEGSMTLRADWLCCSRGGVQRAG